MAASREVSPSARPIPNMPAAGYNTISDENPGLRTFVDGKEDGPVVVFVHGWPDDHALWDKQVCLDSVSCPTVWRNKTMKGEPRANIRY